MSLENQQLSDNTLIRPANDGAEVFVIKNIGGIEIPAFSFVEIVSMAVDATTGARIFSVRRPVSDSLKQTLITGGHSIPATVGEQTILPVSSIDFFHGGIPVKYAGSTPAIGSTVGSTANLFTAKSANKNWLVLGVDAGRNLCFVRPFNGGEDLFPDQIDFDFSPYNSAQLFYPWVSPYYTPWQAITVRPYLSSTLTKVSRTDNIATLTTAAEHLMLDGDFVNVTCNDTSFNATLATVITTATTTMTYANAGPDVIEKVATGTVSIPMPPLRGGRFLINCTSGGGPMTLFGSKVALNGSRTYGVKGTLQFANAAGTIIAESVQYDGCSLTGEPDANYSSGMMGPYNGSLADAAQALGIAFNACTRGETIAQVRLKVEDTSVGAKTSDWVIHYLRGFTAKHIFWLDNQEPVYVEQNHTSRALWEDAAFTLDFPGAVIGPSPVTTPWYPISGTLPYMRGGEFFMVCPDDSSIPEAILTCPLSAAPAIDCQIFIELGNAAGTVVATGFLYQNYMNYFRYSTFLAGPRVSDVPRSVQIYNSNSLSVPTQFRFRTLGAAVGLTLELTPAFMDVTIVDWIDHQIAVPAVNDPTISPTDGHTFVGSHLITMTSPSGGTTSLRYTVDGTVPTPTVGTLYTVPFTITATTTFNMIAYTTELGSRPSSNVMSATITRTA
jgi:hypothetical protein